MVTSMRTQNRFLWGVEGNEAKKMSLIISGVTQHQNGAEFWD